MKLLIMRLYKLSGGFELIKPAPQISWYLTTKEVFDMKLYVYKMKDGIEKSWDDVDFVNDCEIIATIDGDSNEDCEEKAAELYSDTDIYGWTYTEF